MGKRGRFIGSVGGDLGGGDSFRVGTQHMRTSAGVRDDDSRVVDVWVGGKEGRERASVILRPRLGQAPDLTLYDGPLSGEGVACVVALSDAEWRAVVAGLGWLVSEQRGTGNRLVGVAEDLLRRLDPDAERAG